MTAGELPLSRSDRNTVDALITIVPGGLPGLPWALGFLAALLALVFALRAWRVLLPLVGVAMVAWMLGGKPALERAVSRRDSLKPFARAVAARDLDRLAFYGPEVRPVAVYLERPVPMLRSPAAATPGLGIIAAEAAYRRLARSAALSPPLLVAEGRIANLGRGRVVLGVVASDRPVP
jgi:hypothetical protein